MTSLLLSAAPAPKIALPELRSSGLSSDEASALLEFFGDRLAKASGAQVVTPAMTAALIGMERQRQLMGCDEGASSCVAEVASAMGVDFVLTGTLVKLGSGFTIAIKLVDAKTGIARFSASERVSNEDQLSAWLASTAETWGRALAPPTRPIAVGPLVVGGTAVALGVLSGVFLGLSADKAHALKTPGALTSARAIDEAASQGAMFQTVGWLSVGVASAAVVGALVWWLVAPTEAQAHLQLDAGGLAWRLP